MQNQVPGFPQDASYMGMLNDPNYGYSNNMQGSNSMPMPGNYWQQQSDFQRQIQDDMKQFKSSIHEEIY